MICLVYTPIKTILFNINNSCTYRNYSPSSDNFYNYLNVIGRLSSLILRYCSCSCPWPGRTAAGRGRSTCWRTIVVPNTITRLLATTSITPSTLETDFPHWLCGTAPAADPRLAGPLPYWVRALVGAASVQIVSSHYLTSKTKLKAWVQSHKINVPHAFNNIGRWGRFQEMAPE